MRPVLVILGFIIGVVGVMWYREAQCAVGCDATCEAELRKRRQEQIRIQREAREAQRQTTAEAALASRRANEALALQARLRIAQERAAQALEHAAEDERWEQEAIKRERVASLLAQEAEEKAKVAAAVARSAEEALRKAKEISDAALAIYDEDVEIEKGRRELEQCMAEKRQAVEQAAATLAPCESDQGKVEARLEHTKAVYEALMQSLPAGISNGDVIQCYGDIYKVENGKRRHYTWEGYLKANQPTPQKETENCPALLTLNPGPPIF